MNRGQKKTSEVMGNKVAKPVERSCIACRRCNEKKQLLRFVLAPDGTITPDIEGKLPGRGAYTCCSRKCVENAVTRHQFQRSFKGKRVELGAIPLAELMQKIMEQRISGYLALANKAGAVTSGGDAVERVCRSASPPALLLIASDISESICQRLSGIARQANIKVQQVLTKEQIGLLLGKGSDRSAVAVIPNGFARSLIKEIERYRNYLEEDNGQ